MASVAAEPHGDADLLARLRRRRVLIVAGSREMTGSRRYRCEHRSQQLRSLGVESDVVAYNDWDLRGDARAFDAFILHRVHWRSSLDVFFSTTRRLRKPVIYETDDLMFAPALAELVGRRPTMSIDRLREKLNGHLKTLRRSDGVTVSTKPLADFARNENASVEVLTNVVSSEMLTAATSVRRVSGSSVTIGYLSGSPTHDRDFAVAAGGLVRLLETNSAVRLLIVGPLQLDARFDRFGARVCRSDLRPWEELPELLGSIDVNIAPLAADPFSQCKSSVKFLEAALVGTPTIATRTPDFERVIDDGENGFLADTPEDWHQLLGRLVGDVNLRRRLGAAAETAVRRSETTEVRALEHAQKLERLFAGARHRFGRAGLEYARAAVRPLLRFGG